MYKEDLALNNLLGFITIKDNQPASNISIKYEQFTQRISTNNND